MWICICGCCCVDESVDSADPCSVSLCVGIILRMLSSLGRSRTRLGMSSSLLRGSEVADSIDHCLDSIPLVRTVA